MAWPPRFLFIANRVSIDFALTGGEGKFAKWERWHDPGDLCDWFRESSLAVELDGARRADVVVARQLRSAIWNAAQATLRGRKAPAKSIAELHARASCPDLVPELRRGELAWASGATVRRALSSVARDAIDLLGSAARERLRECRNPSCPLLFVDTSRPGKRAWCAMKRCGNLQKTSRYRANLKAAAPRKTR